MDPEALSYSLLAINLASHNTPNPFLVAVMITLATLFVLNAASGRSARSIPRRRTPVMVSKRRIDKDLSRRERSRLTPGEGDAQER